MGISRRALLAGTASLVATVAIPAGVATAGIPPNVAVTTTAMRTVLSGIRRSIQSLEFWRTKGCEEFIMDRWPDFDNWVQAVCDDEALESLIRQRLQSIYKQLGQHPEDQLLHRSDPSTMGFLAQEIHAKELPIELQIAGNPEFFGALLELAPDHLKSPHS